jgi:hypothetical protein
MNALSFQQWAACTSRHPKEILGRTGRSAFYLLSEAILGHALKLPSHSFALRHCLQLYLLLRSSVTRLLEDYALM